MGDPVFSAGQEAVFSWSVSDSSDISLSWLNIGGPSGWVTEWCGFAIEASRVGGSGEEGVFEVRCEIPANAVSQNYTAFIHAKDVFELSTGELQFDFSVVGGSDDSQAPELTDISFNLSSVGPDEELVLTWTASDESGLKYVVPWLALNGYSFADNTGRIYAETWGQTQTLISGDSTVGTYSQVMPFAVSAPAGTYTLWFSVSDLLGNRDFYQVPLTIERTN
jgi:hypothetical protein